MSSGKLRLKGSMVTEGVRRQNESAGEICVKDSTIFRGGGFSESISSVAKFRNMSRRGPDTSSMPRRSIEMRAIARDRLCRTRSGSSIATLTWPSMLPPPTKSDAPRCKSVEIRGWRWTGQSAISVVLGSLLNVREGMRRVFSDVTGS
jgi:hypothetical protein